MMMPFTSLSMPIGQNIHTYVGGGGRDDNKDDGGTNGE